MARLHKARPNTSATAMQKWYKHHADFRDGRRTDPTAGHIMKGMRGLLPAPLPPILTTASVLEKGSRASMTLSASPSNASLSAMDLDESSYTVDGGWSSQSSLMDKSSQMRSTGTRGSTSVVLSASGRKGLHTAPSVDGGGSAFGSVASKGSTRSRATKDTFDKIRKPAGYKKLHGMGDSETLASLVRGATPFLSRRFSPAVLLPSFHDVHAHNAHGRLCT
jgi:hypothetical protein